MQPCVGRPQRAGLTPMFHPSCSKVVSVFSFHSQQIISACQVGYGGLVLVVRHQQTHLISLQVVWHYKRCHCVVLINDAVFSWLS